MDYEVAADGRNGPVASESSGFEGKLVPWCRIRPVVPAVAARQQLLPGAYEKRRGAEADERGPLAALDRDVAQHLGDESHTEPVLCPQRLVETLPFNGEKSTHEEREDARHPPGGRWSR